jgi:hypothetical protein
MLAGSALRPPNGYVATRPGQITSRLPESLVQPFLQKYSDFQKPQITLELPAVPSHQEGRLAIVTNAGRDAVDADAPLTNGA